MKIVGTEGVGGDEVGGALLRQHLDEVDVLAALVVAAVSIPSVEGEVPVLIRDARSLPLHHPSGGIAFRIERRERGSEGFGHGPRTEGLGGDQDDLSILAAAFGLAEAMD